MWPMVATEFVKVRVPLDVKQRVSVAAERRYVREFASGAFGRSEALAGSGGVSHHDSKGRSFAFTSVGMENDPSACRHSHDLVADVNRKSRRLLKRIARDFRKKHGDLISNLPSYRISALQLLDLSPRGMKREQSDQVSVTDALTELKSRGYLSDFDGMWVALTESGLQEGTRGPLGRLWGFLDSSKGVATMAAALGLVLSVATLVWQCTSASGTPLQQSGAP